MGNHTHAKKKPSASGADRIQHIAGAPHLTTRYLILENLEAGLALTGTEVKSIREEAPQIRDAYVEILALTRARAPETLLDAKNRGKKKPTLKSRKPGFSAWLVNMHIGPYSHGNIYNHITTRRRQILIHRHQLEKLHGAIIQKGLTVIPSRLYFKNGRIKVELALVRGRKGHDHRQSIEKEMHRRELRERDD